jgi:hypothetical protein
MDGYLVAKKQLKARVPTVKTAILNLQLHRPFGIFEALQSLREKKWGAEMAGILFDLAPDKLREAGNCSLADLAEVVVTEINNVAPILEESILADDVGEGFVFLYPECAGYPMSWEDYGDLMDNARSGDCDENMRLYLFFSMLRLGDSDEFNAVSDAFGWEVAYQDVENLDLERLKGLLQKADLECFADTLNVCWYMTGNLYFDYNPYDEGEDPGWLPAFNREGIAELRRQWQEALPIIDHLNQAVERFANEPSLAIKLMDCLAACSKVVEKPPAHRPMTLAELWGEDDEEQAARIRVRL